MKPSSDQAILALQLAIDAGKLIRDLRHQALEVNLKGPRDLVTSADLAADRMIVGRIREHFPTHVILSEESAPALDPLSLHGPLWVIDPIDGTTNYALGHYHCAVSIAYYDHGIGQVGVVHAPFIEETFFAERGQGAFLNGKAFRRQAEALDAALVATGFPYGRDPANVAMLARRVRKVLLHCRDLRRLGAASLDACWVACGRLGAYYESVNPWDIAAARIVAIEAGAVCGNIYTPADGSPDSALGELYSEHFLVTAAGLFDEMQALLRFADQEQA